MTQLPTNNMTFRRTPLSGMYSGDMLPTGYQASNAEVKSVLWRTNNRLHVGDGGLEFRANLADWRQRKEGNRPSL